MRTWAAILMGLTAASAGAAEAPSAEELLRAMDKNLTFQSRSSRMTMTVEGRRTRAFEMVSYSRGQDDSAVEYVAPARDKGTRMLKLGGELWIFLPSVDKVQKISGHMLRQGMMGSDVSYEDLMTSREWQKVYTARVTGEGAVGGRPCWKLEMVARDETVSYPKRVTCVDKEEMIPLRQELYALSGMLLKTWTMSDVKPFEGGRRFPTKMAIEDHVRKESVTRIEFKEIKFGVPLEKETFSLRWLERR
jgi:outer membrane lipoprotein-sorting protein